MGKYGGKNLRLPPVDDHRSEGQRQLKNDHSSQFKRGILNGGKHIQFLSI